MLSVIRRCEWNVKCYFGQVLMITLLGKKKEPSNKFYQKIAAIIFRGERWVAQNISQHFVSTGFRVIHALTFSNIFLQKLIHNAKISEGASWSQKTTRKEGKPCYSCYTCSLMPVFQPSLSHVSSW